MVTVNEFRRHPNGFQGINQPPRIAVLFEVGGLTIPKRTAGNLALDSQLGQYPHRTLDPAMAGIIMEVEFVLHVGRLSESI